MLSEPLFEREKKQMEANNNDSLLLRKLTKELSEGNAFAWEQLYKRLFDSLASFVDRIVRSREDALDITQEVFAYLWQNLDKIQPDKSIKSYLYIVAKSLAFKYLRGKAKADGFASLSEYPEIPIEDISPDDIVVANELKVLVAVALETMPRQRRQVFEMSRYEGLSYDEIAQKLNLSKRTVELHIYRVTKELKELLYLAALLLTGDSIIS